MKSNGQSVDQMYVKTIEELKHLKKIIDAVNAIGCMECWISGHPLVGDHQHPPRPAFFNGWVSGLCAATRTDNTYWPYCFTCWIPFQEPCLHTPITRGASNDGSFCPFHHRFPNMIPSLIALIYFHDSSTTYLTGISQALGVPVQQLQQSPSFKQWLREHPNGPQEMPNCYRFLITFSKLFHDV